MSDREESGQQAGLVRGVEQAVLAPGVEERSPERGSVAGQRSCDMRDRRRPWSIGGKLDEASFEWNGHRRVNRRRAFIVCDDSRCGGHGRLGVWRSPTKSLPHPALGFIGPWWG